METLKVKISDVDGRTSTITKEDERIYNNSINELKENNIPYLETMGLALRFGDLHLKSIEEIANRAIALFGLAVYSEVVLTDDVDNKYAQMELDLLEKTFSNNKYMTKLEKEYTKTINKNKAIQFIWRYESCATLLWTLGLFDLNNVVDICNVSQLANLIRSFDDLESLIKSAKLRTVEEIFQMQDKTMRYRWACIECRLKNKPLKNVDEGLMYERQHALNWVLTTYFGNNWDEIDTPA